MLLVFVKDSLDIKEELKVDMKLTNDSACIARGIAYAPYTDLIWMETKSPIYAQ